MNTIYCPSTSLQSVLRGPWQRSVPIHHVQAAIYNASPTVSLRERALVTRDDIRAAYEQLRQIDSPSMRSSLTLLTERVRLLSSEPSSQNIENYLMSTLDHVPDSPIQRDALYILLVGESVSSYDIRNFLKNPIYSELPELQEEVCSAIVDLYHAGVEGFGDYLRVSTHDPKLHSQKIDRIQSVLSEFKVALHYATRSPATRVCLSESYPVNWSDLNESEEKFLEEEVDPILHPDLRDSYRSHHHSKIDLEVTTPGGIRLVEVKLYQGSSWKPKPQVAGQSLLQIMRYALATRRHHASGIEYYVMADGIDPVFLEKMKLGLRATGLPFLFQKENGSLQAIDANNLEKILVSDYSPTPKNRPLPTLPSALYIPEPLSKRIPSSVKAKPSTSTRDELPWNKDIQKILNRIFPSESGIDAERIRRPSQLAHVCRSNIKNVSYSIPGMMVRLRDEIRKGGLEGNDIIRKEIRRFEERNIRECLSTDSVNHLIRIASLISLGGQSGDGSPAKGTEIPSSEPGTSLGIAKVFSRWSIQERNWFQALCERNADNISSVAQLIGDSTSIMSDQEALEELKSDLQESDPSELVADPYTAIEAIEYLDQDPQLLTDFFPDWTLDRVKKIRSSFQDYQRTWSELDKSIHRSSQGLMSFPQLLESFRRPVQDLIGFFHDITEIPYLLSNARDWILIGSVDSNSGTSGAAIKSLRIIPHDGDHLVPSDHFGLFFRISEDSLRFTKASGSLALDLATAHISARIGDPLDHAVEKLLIRNRLTDDPMSLPESAVLDYLARQDGERNPPVYTLGLLHQALDGHSVIGERFALDVVTSRIPNRGVSVVTDILLKSETVPHNNQDSQLTFEWPDGKPRLVSASGPNAMEMGAAFYHAMLGDVKNDPVEMALFSGFLGIPTMVEEEKVREYHRRNDRDDRLSRLWDIKRKIRIDLAPERTGFAIRGDKTVFYGEKSEEASFIINPQLVLDNGTPHERSRG